MTPHFWKSFGLGIGVTILLAIVMVRLGWE